MTENNDKKKVGMKKIIDFIKFPLEERIEIYIGNDPDHPGYSTIPEGILS